VLNARDVAALNRAREVLKRLEDVALNRALGEHDPFAPVAGWDLGRLSEAATAADDAILHVLRTARTYCGVKITDAQLAGRAAANQPTASVAQPTDATDPTDASKACVPEQIANARAAHQPRDLRAAGGSTGRYF
jgi:hypothetical protein